MTIIARFHLFSTIADWQYKECSSAVFTTKFGRSAISLVPPYSILSASRSNKIIHLSKNLCFRTPVTNGECVDI